MKICLYACILFLIVFQKFYIRSSYCQTNIQCITREELIEIVSNDEKMLKDIDLDKIDYLCWDFETNKIIYPQISNSKEISLINLLSSSSPQNHDNNSCIVLTNNDVLDVCLYELSKADISTTSEFFESIWKFIPMERTLFYIFKNIISTEQKTLPAQLSVLYRSNICNMIFSFTPLVDINNSTFKNDIYSFVKNKRSFDKDIRLYIWVLIGDKILGTISSEINATIESNTTGTKDNFEHLTLHKSIHPVKYIFLG